MQAAGENPFLASWIAVLDQYQLPSFAEIAPGDWWESFQEFWHEGYVNDDDMSSIDVNREFWKQTPPKHEISDSYSALQSNRKKGINMSEFDVFEKPSAIMRPTNGSALHQVQRSSQSQSPALASVFEQPAVKLTAFTPLEQLPSMRTGNGNGVVAAFDHPATKPTRSIETSRERDFSNVDPRSYIHEFNPQVVCCSKPMDLHYDDGRDVSGELGTKDGRDYMMLEYVFHATCSICDTEGHFSFVKPVPKSIVEEQGLL